MTGCLTQKQAAEAAWWAILFHRADWVQTVIPSHTHGYCICFLLGVFVYHSWPGWFRHRVVLCGTAQRPHAVDRGCLSHPFLLHAESVPSWWSRDVLCHLSSVLVNPWLGCPLNMPNLTSPHSVLQNHTCIRGQTSLSPALPWTAGFLHVWLQPTSLQPLMPTRAAGNSPIQLFC